MFGFKSKKQIRIEQELEAAKRQIEEEKKKAQLQIEREKKKAQAIHEESLTLKERLLEKQRHIEYLLNVIQLEQYRQEDELRQELNQLEHVSAEEQFARFQKIKERFRPDSTEARKAIKKYENQHKKRITVERGMSR